MASSGSTGISGRDNSVRSVDYAEWAARKLGRVVGDVLAVEIPEAATTALIEEARRRDVATIVCGFLPDELSEPGVLDAGAMGFFIERFVFLPFVLEATDAPRGPSSVVCFDDVETADALAAATIALAEAWSHATSLPLARLDPTRMGAEELSHAVAGAAVVFNATRDWSTGFAIDELAARCGRRSVRMGNPGYSPLRYGLLGQMLNASWLPELPALRPMFGEIIKPRLPEPRAEVSASVWQRIFGAPAFRAFWNDANLVALNSEAASPPRRWLNRPAGWAALAAAADDAEFPRPAWKRAVDLVTEWILAEQRTRVWGHVREQALGRWVRRNPAWLETWRKLAGAIGEGSIAARRWIDAAAGQQGQGTSVAPVLRAGAWALDESATATESAIALGWLKRDWTAVSQGTARLRSLRPVWRVACVNVCLRPPSEEAEGTAPALPAAAFESDPAPWRVCFGAAAPFVRTIVALRSGRRDVARRTWRGFLSENGHGGQAGWARLARAGLPDDAARVSWLEGVASEGELPALRRRLVWPWLWKRVPDIWRFRPATGILGELSIAVRLLECENAGRASSPGGLALLAPLAVLAGREDFRLDLLRRFAAETGDAGDLPSVVALALWCRGRASRVSEALALRAISERDIPWTIFDRALVCQLTGDEAGAEAAVTLLHRVSPGFYGEKGAPDFRWAWSAVLFKKAGMLREAAQMHAASEAAGFPNVGVYDEIASDGMALAAGWSVLLRGKSE
jgi:hypothetical protein